MSLFRSTVSIIKHCCLGRSECAVAVAIVCTDAVIVDPAVHHQVGLAVTIDVADSHSAATLRRKSAVVGFAGKCSVAAIVEVKHRTALVFTRIAVESDNVGITIEVEISNTEDSGVPLLAVIVADAHLIVECKAINH